jgi:flagellar biosynthetic protein FlhB
VAEDNRTEQATPRRRWKARQKGQVARSHELSSALALLAVVILLWGFPQPWPQDWREFFHRLLATAGKGTITRDTNLLGWTEALVVGWAAPAAVLCWGVALASSLAQGGLVFAPSALTPSVDRFNPASNLKRLISLGAVSRLLKSLIPTGVLLYLFVSVLIRDWGEFVNVARLGPRIALLRVLDGIFEVAWKAGVVFLLWAVVDYGLQRFNFERQLRMTQEEVREENKETEGHPMVRMRIRRAQRQMRRRRILQQVKRATVVVTNPTEYAVALEYRVEEMEAPVVVAKGRNRLAQLIKREARWHEIPIVENPPLAQALYRAVEVGQAIPAKLYAVVAEILAFIYRAHARAREAARTAPNSRAGA